MTYIVLKAPLNSNQPTYNLEPSPVAVLQLWSRDMLQHR